ncbi:hypothetical protein DIS24_g2542 [Lasiodiplodia hormozganensis]|uniref:BZIP domain-containing protein n=1 Tax=Lasiodiplodia hormozganensis TaxID=869390 RepID=A0AA39Z101_9PEZI|nr:hypothetical protein DIS24_g2542 [Lasiodiplodia hormozganensis]
MDYSSYFSVPPPQQYYIGLPPTPSYDSSSDKLNLQSHLDPTSFLQYDAFSFPSLPAGSPPAHSHSSAVAPQLHSVGSVDSGIHLDLDAANSTQHIQHTQASPIHATLSTAPGAAGLYSSSASSSDALSSAQQQQQQQQQQPPIGSVSSPSHPTSPTIGGQHTRSSSEEKENGANSNSNNASNNLTPAQSRRKAQNRAAQRAFRERKERHVRELEEKLRALESSTHSLQSDNERLKLLLQRAKTENEILRATNHHQHRRAGSTGSGSGSGGSRSASPGDAGDGEMQLDLERDPYTTVRGDGTGAAPTGSTGGGLGGSGHHARANVGRSTPHLLGASQTWDLIQSHPLVRSGAVDVADVCERLRTAARCDGQGPVFEEAAIYRVIEEESSRGGGDALI